MLASDILHRWTRTFLAVLLVCCLAMSGCKQSEPQPSGRAGLVVAIETDLSLPKDLDALRLEVLQGSTILFKHEQPLGEGAQALPLSIEVPDVERDARLLVRAVGLKEDRERIERSALATVPTSHVGLIRLTLNYLCAGMVSNGESSCGSARTCIQGSCESASVDALPDYGMLDQAVVASTPCFDVAKCFSDAAELVPDAADSCSVTSSEARADFNLALRLEPGADGFCTQTACWVVLNADEDGFRVDGDRVFLPESICAMRGLRVVLSAQCPAKQANTPVCPGSNASVSESSRKISAGVGRSTAANTCMGSATRACGLCGTQTRSCQNGQWSELGACFDQGECMPEATEDCGARGHRTCGGNCVWGGCEDQSCDGPDTRSCGNCGTQHRTCHNGSWAEWSACSEEGACSPGTTQACGSGGTQACQGNCEWSACAMQVCEGAVSKPCGNCGTQTRTCETSSADWSDWNECQDQGECRPDSTRSCGRDGTQTCGGNCRWEKSCSLQTCEGAARRACGRCGSQTRACDNTTGQFSDWSACSDEGECTPDEMRACGSGGQQTCGGNCAWEKSCASQMCEGAAQRACGRCGSQTRACDSTTGEYSDWSPCSDEGECTPDDSRECGSGGQQTCGSDCRWEKSCGMQACEGAARRACGRCGSQTRTCDSASGKYSDWSACSDEGECMPDDSRECGSGGRQTCGSDCRWVAMCTGQACDGSSMRDCGRCGVQTRSCDTDTSQWSDWGTCSDQGDCTPGETRMCELNGKRTCLSSCRWDPNCQAQPCTGPKEQPCPNNPCVVQTRTCDESRGQWSDWTPSCPADSCRPGQTDANGCMPHAQRTCDEATCSWGSACKCMAPYSWCPDNTCHDLGTDPQNCGQCGKGCSEGQSCAAGGCQCAADETRCDESCVKTQTNPEHCGGCNLACATNELCIAGKCEMDCSGGKCDCPAGQRRCADGQCKARSAISCGPACLACPSIEGADVTCSADDECRYTCSSGGPLCGEACCAADQVCENNTCHAATAPAGSGSP